jgi:subtilisin family serine protease
VTRRIALLSAVGALALPGTALAGRYAVGLEPGSSFHDVAARVRAATGGRVSSLYPLRALVVRAPSARGLARLPGVTYVERLRSRRLQFVPNDPLAPKQWWLAVDRAFDTWPDALPTLAPVKVGIVDSGIDIGHPEFEGKIAAQRSFVGGDVTDEEGHGTFVAGEIAAAVDNGQGIAGMAFPAQLVVAKVVRGDGSISLDAEARAIRWAVDQGARVINLSIGGVRDPLDPRVDSYSPLEEAAVDYAEDHGALVVAAVGNSDQAPSIPWSYASYPAALPHVVGVSALAPDGTIPAFSNRDAVFNDIAAPGDQMISTFPRDLTDRPPPCADQGYSTCAGPDYRDAEGTSFSAPQVSAAAALIFATRPGLAPEQVAALLERSAADLTPATGCLRCTTGRDALSGAGRLDVTAALAALAGPPPAADRYETNDDAGSRAYSLYGRVRNVVATLDFWDDQIDVYRVKLQAGQRLWASLRGPAGTDTNLALWRPGTARVEGLSPKVQANRVTQSVRSGPNESFAYRAPLGGWYYVEVKLATPGSGGYALRLVKSPAPVPAG